MNSTWQREKVAIGSSVNSPDEKKKGGREEDRSGRPGLCSPIVQLTRCQSNIVDGNGHDRVRMVINEVGPLI